MKLRQTLTALLIAAPITALAEGGAHPEFFYQAPAGKHDLTGSLSMVALKTEVPGAAVKVSGMTVGAEYEFGLNEHMSLGAAIGYVNQQVETDASIQIPTIDVTGLSDLEILFKGNLGLGAGILRYGATLGYALEKAETDANGNLNAASGGSELTPYIGWSLETGGNHLGAKISRSFEIITREYDNKAVSEKGEIEGGEIMTISGFYEYKMDADMMLGGSLSYVTTEDTTQTPDGGVGSKSEEINPVYNIDVYGTVPVGPGTLLPTFTYVTSSDDKVDGVKVDSYTGTSFEVAYRYAF